MSKSFFKPAHEVALLLRVKPARTPAGRAVQAKVLFRIEVSMWIDEALKA